MAPLLNIFIFIRPSIQPFCRLGNRIRKQLGECGTDSMAYFSSREQKNKCRPAAPRLPPLVDAGLELETGRGRRSRLLLLLSGFAAARGGLLLLVVGLGEFENDEDLVLEHLLPETKAEPDHLVGEAADVGVVRAAGGDRDGRVFGEKEGAVEGGLRMKPDGV